METLFSPEILQTRRSMVGRDVEKMLAVGLVWGATNALMRRGAIIWDQALKSTPQTNTPLLKKWLKLLFIWQYTLPFLINLSASATFFAILSDSPISVPVPVTNATTFAATAVFGIILGEETRVGLALFVKPRKGYRRTITHIALAFLFTFTHGASSLWARQPPPPILVLFTVNSMLHALFILCFSGNNLDAKEVSTTIWS